MKKRITILTVVLLFIMLLSILSACVPKDREAAIKKLSEKGYKEVTIGQLYGNAIVYYSGNNYDTRISGIYEAEGDGEYIVVIWFKETKYAKSFILSADEKETYYDEIRNKLQTYSSDIVMPTRSGKIIYFGTQKGVEDFK
ncbi:MAG: hypothetical protein LBF68_02980 [Christensenellaceae bacterium]|jgi:outer membrane lipoprotein-sorting protein|nr:hypothetical protein [Christensenellaceae bacterium]